MRVAWGNWEMGNGKCIGPGGRNICNSHRTSHIAGGNAVLDAVSLASCHLFVLIYRALLAGPEFWEWAWGWGWVLCIGYRVLGFGFGLGSVAASWLLTMRVE